VVCIVSRLILYISKKLRLREVKLPLDFGADTILLFILNQRWNHIYVILWPTLNEMQQFELLVGSNKAALQYNNPFRNIM